MNYNIVVLLTFLLDTVSRLEAVLVVLLKGTLYSELNSRNWEATG